MHTLISPIYRHINMRATYMKREGDTNTQMEVSFFAEEDGDRVQIFSISSVPKTQ